MNFTRLIYSLLVVVGLSSFSGAAAAQHGHFIQGVRPEVHGDLGFHGFLGAGFDIEIPIVPRGFLRGMDDELALVPGLDVIFFDFHKDLDRRGFGFAPNLTAQWNIYFSRRWSVFPEVGFTLLFVTEKDHRFYRGYGKGRNAYADAVVAAGARLHVSDRFAVVFRIGYPFGGQIGINF